LIKSTRRPIPEGTAHGGIAKPRNVSFAASGFGSPEKLANAGV
jgi:hypothetical protein